MEKERIILSRNEVKLLLETPNRKKIILIEGFLPIVATRDYKIYRLVINRKADQKYFSGIYSEYNDPTIKLPETVDPYNVEFKEVTKKKKITYVYE